MSKKIVIPSRAVAQPSADKWVQEASAADQTPKVKPKRLTIDVDPDLHQELKLFCVKRNTEIATFLRGLIRGAVGEQVASE